MNEVELLRTIRPAWLNRVLQSTARGAGVRQDAREQVEKFFDLLQTSLESGDPSWLDPILTDWSTSPTETELESGPSQVTRFLGEIMQVTFQVIQESLPPETSQSLTTSLIPAFVYSFEKTAQSEIKTRVDYAINEQETKRQEIERLDRSKSDFIAVAAHELKTPLTLIEGYSAMLSDSLRCEKTSELEASMLDGIHHGTRRLRSIIDDMIDVSLIDNQMISLTYQPVWVNRLLVALQAELQKALQERNQQLCIVNFSGCDQMIFGDPERLMQVFRNLILNAIKFTPDGGRIDIDGRELPGFIEVYIKDSGIGIDPEDQIVIFDKFARLSDSALHSSGKTKFKGGGPGLGLHIAKGMVEAHGGTIWVESPGYDEKNCPGSTFHVLLPIQSEPPDKRAGKLFAPLLKNKSTFH